MKKYIAFCFVIFSLIICSCSNNPSKITDTDELLDINSNVSEAVNSNISEKNDLEIETDNKVHFRIKTEKEIYPSNETEIIYTIFNVEGRDEQCFGESGYYLQKKEKGTWNYVLPKKGMFIEGGALVCAKEHTQRMLLDEYYDLPLKSGIYRITNKFDESIVSNEFEVVE